MRRLALTFLCALIGWGLMPRVKAQNISDTTTIAEYKDQVRQLISYLEYTFNAIGDSMASAREREIMIGQSYLKIFRDAEVQIEDDLAEYRSTVTNKDVQAYLKDIDFFFKQANFEFLVNEINHELNEQGDLYFKVSMDRVLKGITLEGDTMNHIQPRFVEVNLDPESRVLKIASIYTTQLSEEEDLANWWNQLPFDWQALFAREISVTDEQTMADLLAINDTIGVGDTIILVDGEALVLDTELLYSGLRRIMKMEKMDLSDNPSLTNLEPLSKLTRLKEVNISGTIIRDLVPLRNLTRLEVLKCENTRVDDISPLRYAVNLREIVAGNSRLRDLEPLQNFPGLNRLELHHTQIQDISVLAQLKELRELYLNQTGITGIEALKGLNKLEILNISETSVGDLRPLAGGRSLMTLYLEDTPVSDLSPLSNIQSLRLIFADGSEISSLDPLVNIPSLRKIYCDKTFITRVIANRFLRSRPGCLIIYDSATLQQWWQTISNDWKAIFTAQVPVSALPAREELHEVAGITRIDINNHARIIDLGPLQMLTNLEELHCAYTGVDTLGPLVDLVQLKVLDVSFTGIGSLAPLKFLTRLEELNIGRTEVNTLEDLAGLQNLEWLDADYTMISDLTYLQELKKLKQIYCDSTGVTTLEVRKFLLSNPDCLVVFKSAALERWWEDLSPDWQRVIRAHGRIDQIPDREQLHQVVSLEGISVIDNQSIRDIKPLNEFLRLKTVKISNTGVASLVPLGKIISLEMLDCSQNPLESLSALIDLKNLRYLNVENTPIRDLNAIAGLINLEELVCSGTQIRDLKALSSLYKLNTLDCSNTDIRKLNELEGLLSLRLLKCFNTRLNEKKVADFLATHPSCEVVFY